MSTEHRYLLTQHTHSSSTHQPLILNIHQCPGHINESSGPCVIWENYIFIMTDNWQHGTGAWYAVAVTHTHLGQTRVPSSTPTIGLPLFVNGGGRWQSGSVCLCVSTFESVRMYERGLRDNPTGKVDSQEVADVTGWAVHTYSDCSVTNGEPTISAMTILLTSAKLFTDISKFDSNVQYLDGQR